MPKEIQKPGTAQSVVEATGAKGRFPMSVDEIAVGIYSLLDLEQSPYGREAIPCGSYGEQAGAGAGLFSHVGVYAPAVNGAILEVRAVEVVNHTGGATVFWIRYMNSGTLALVTQTGTNNLVNFNPRGGGLAPTAPGVLFTGTRNVLAGQSLAKVEIPAQADMYRVTFPHGFFLYGENGDAVVMTNNNANVVGIANFYCRAWPPTG